MFFCDHSMNMTPVVGLGPSPSPSSSHPITCINILIAIYIHIYYQYQHDWESSSISTELPLFVNILRYPSSEEKCFTSWKSISELVLDKIVDFTWLQHKMIVHIKTAILSEYLPAIWFYIPKHLYRIKQSLGWRKVVKLPRLSAAWEISQIKMIGHITIIILVDNVAPSSINLSWWADDKQQE